jgi:hypothetical protein
MAAGAWLSFSKDFQSNTEEGTSPPFPRSSADELLWISYLLMVGR